VKLNIAKWEADFYIEFEDRFQNRFRWMASCPEAGVTADFAKTTLAAPAKAGDTEIQVQSFEGFQEGDKIRIGEELCVIEALLDPALLSSRAQLILLYPLKNSFTPGVVVKVAPVTINHVWQVQGEGKQGPELSDPTEDQGVYPDFFNYPIDFRMEQDCWNVSWITKDAVTDAETVQEYKFEHRIKEVVKIKVAYNTRENPVLPNASVQIIKWEDEGDEHWQHSFEEHDSMKIMLYDFIPGTAADVLQDVDALDGELTAGGGDVDALDSMDFEKVSPSPLPSGMMSISEAEMTPLLGK